jgi:hypothetical protein
MKSATRMIAAVIAVGVVAPLPAAIAKNPRDIRVAGTCSGSSTAKIKLSPENGRIEVEFEADQNRNGVSWNWGLARNGKTVASGRAVTKAPSGSFSVRRVLSNASGPDRITVRASRANGEVCTARATF